MRWWWRRWGLTVRGLSGGIGHKCLIVDIWPGAEALETVALSHSLLLLLLYLLLLLELVKRAVY